MWESEAGGHVISRLMVAGHRCRRRPGKVVVEHLPQRRVLGQSDIDESLVEASDRAAIHFFVLAVAAMHPDDRRFVTIGIGVSAGPTECLGPVSSESLYVLRMEAVAECMADHLVGDYPIMPGPGKTT